MQTQELSCLLCLLAQLSGRSSQAASIPMASEAAVVPQWPPLPPLQRDQLNVLLLVPRRAEEAPTSAAHVNDCNGSEDFLTLTWRRNIDGSLDNASVQLQSRHQLRVALTPPSNEPQQAQVPHFRLTEPNKAFTL